MKMRWAWTFPVLSILALLGVQTAYGQYGPMPGGYGPPGYGQMPGYGLAMQAGYMGGPGQPGLLPDAYGAYGAAESGPPPGGPVPMGPDLMAGDGSGCQYCGGMGCDACGGGMGGLGNGLLGDVFGLVAPYPDGGCAAVRWYDFSVDFMALRREDAGRRVDFASLGVAGPIVLDSDDLDFDNEPSFRFSAMFQVGPANSVEFTYFGLFFWDDRVTATSNAADPDDRLFSAFSNFGLLPGGVPPGFVETDRSDLQYIDYESSFDSFELNLRKRWVAPNCRYQGSWLFGIRYFKLDEDFNYFTQSIANQTDPDIIPSMNNNINVHNNMTGAQIGGDLWMCVLPGLRLGGEMKAGVFGNRIAVENTIEVNTGAAPSVEDLVTNDVSFIGQADLLMTYRLNYNWTLRGGYQFLYVDGVALATENFNPVAPAIIDPTSTRTPFINDNGGVFYHGWTIGAEFMW